MRRSNRQIVLTEVRWRIRELGSWILRGLPGHVLLDGFCEYPGGNTYFVPRYDEMGGIVRNRSDRRRDIANSLWSGAMRLMLLYLPSETAIHFQRIFTATPQ